MNLWNLDDLESINGKTGIKIQKVPHSYSTQSVQLSFEPKANLPLHSTPVDVLFYVIEGVGELVIGDEKQTCFAGSYVESPKDIPHGWTNLSDKELKILVIKLFS